MCTWKWWRVCFVFITAPDPRHATARKTHIRPPTANVVCFQHGPKDISDLSNLKVLRGRLLVNHGFNANGHRCKHHNKPDRPIVKGKSINVAWSHIERRRRGRHVHLEARYGILSKSEHAKSANVTYDIFLRL